jgi:hypothetical protein
MPKYLTVASYTAQGAKGLLKEGGTARRRCCRGIDEELGRTPGGFLFRVR